MVPRWDAFNLRRLDFASNIADNWTKFTAIRTTFRSYQPEYPFGQNQECPFAYRCMGGSSQCLEHVYHRRQSRRCCRKGDRCYYL